ncbi:cytochrome c biogenesis protein [Puniceicoccus vermicola]|uniref:Cytochrome c biogenesis protein CcsA n=1 Tax=Puniceicoccus vermicola TaxID=388746 RepID=A0A7X1AX51_9BACT|nr:cytochrome c biogenesis protein CcsA [Puniceicoccus vermicola]MBC2601591.1 cytochrome c biogenesis protein CcsA [Puniceicoccus vermicola]
MKLSRKLVPWIAFILGLVYVSSGWLPKKSSPTFDFESFGKLPVQVGGRIKPLDSVARNSLLILSERQKAVLPAEEAEAEDQTVPALIWLVEVATRPEVADRMKVFRVLHPQLRNTLGIMDDAGKVFSYSDLQPYFGEISRLQEQVNPEPKQRDSFEEAVVRLNENLTRYHRLLHSFHPLGNLDQLTQEYESYQLIMAPGLAQLSLQQNGQPHEAQILENFMAFADRYLKLSQQAMLRVVPPEGDDPVNNDWENVGDSLLRSIQTGTLSPTVLQYAILTEAYRSGDVETFNQTVQDMRSNFRERFPDEKFRVSFEFLFNAAEPFYRASVLYVLVLVLVLISWLRWGPVLNSTAYALLLAAFLMHTFGLLARMYIQGRPPVTNLYSSAVFVGWGAVFLGIIFERFFRNGFGSATSALIGFSTLIIAHHLSLSGDTLEMMRAVLDSNFWLATHVIVITIGYSGVFLAGALAVFAILRGVLTPSLDRKTEKSLYTMVYGITCFSILTSFVGTMLGGIWADQSWGRFWGWDPKENGALLIVIWTAIMLHARWGALVKARGFFILAVFGNIVTAWSWFGTNMLGVGLHSYGFMNAAFFWLSAFVASQLVIMGLAAIPKERWRSAHNLVRG